MAQLGVAPSWHFASHPQLGTGEQKRLPSPVGHYATLSQMVLPHCQERFTLFLFFFFCTIQQVTIKAHFGVGGWGWKSHNNNRQASPEERNPPPPGPVLKRKEPCHLCKEG